VATRTWVSGVGDDVNPCSRTAPCKTFAGAISKTAAGGEISVLDPGGFGAVTITKGMTIDGSEGSGFGSILAAGTSGIIINAGLNDVVTLRNLSINGAGTGIDGIRILRAAAVYIENCEIFGFLAVNGVNAGMAIRDARTNTGNLFVTGCTLRNNSQVGVNLIPGAGGKITAVIDNCWIQGNKAAGISVFFGSLATVSNSIISGNPANGISVEGNTSECNIENCVIAHNGTGILVQSGAPVARLSGSTVVNNNFGIGLNAGTVFSYVNNRIAGNTSGNAPSPGQTIPLR